MKTQVPNGNGVKKIKRKFMINIKRNKRRKLLINFQSLKILIPF